MKAKTNDKPKKPLVNWFKREKETSYSDYTNNKGEKVSVKTKVVKAPESKVSKGFEKTKVTESVKRKDPNLFKKIGGVAGGIGLGVAGTENSNKNKAQKRLNQIQNDPRFSQKNKQGYRDDMKLRDEYIRGGLTTAVAAPLIGTAIDMARGKSKVISKTKTKVVAPRKK
jgi:hypothetical protein